MYRSKTLSSFLIAIGLISIMIGIWLYFTREFGQMPADYYVSSEVLLRIIFVTCGFLCTTIGLVIRGIVTELISDMDKVKLEIIELQNKIKNINKDNGK
ncbi:MAG: hypothetical protein ACOYWZ_07850 [Bacillota bacterium]